MELNMLRKLAWSFASSTDIEFDDLFQEAALVWCKAENDKRYDSRKAAFNTFAYLRILNNLKTMATKDKKYRSNKIPIDGNIQSIADTKVTPEQHLEWSDLLKTLSDDTRFVIKMIFESPEEFIELAGSKGLLVELLGSKGVPKERASDVINEIKGMLAND